MRIRKEIKIDSENLENMANIADALSHPIRIAILQYISYKDSVSNDICNKDLVEKFHYSQSTISQHVKKLVESQLVLTEQRDNFRIYKLNRDVLKKFSSFIIQI